MNIKILRKAIITITGLVLSSSLASSLDGSKEQVFIQIERLTVRLEMKNNNGQYESRGTGFFVLDEKNQLYIVTARHVVLGAGNLRARVPSLVIANGKTENVVLKLPSDQWILGDDNDKDLQPVDVAVMRLGGLKDRQIVSFLYCPTKCADGSYNQLADDPHPMDHVTVLGFPYDLGFQFKEQRPMVREGIVSFTSDESPFIKVAPDPRYMRKGAFIIDCHVFGGNSGGPVLVSNPLAPITLGGLITGTNAALFFGFVTPTSHIRSVLDKAVNAAPNMSAWFLGDPDEQVAPTK
jgi:hypothetical protein